MSDDIMYDSKEDCYMVSEERLEEFEKALKERDELAAELERCVVMGGDGPIGNLPWKPGNSCSEFYDGERFFVALRVGSGEGVDRREWWEFFVVQAVCDEVTTLYFTSEPEYWGWEWEDVEWYVELNDLISTLPPDSVPEVPEGDK